jgi:hypothetical protein
MKHQTYYALIIFLLLLVWYLFKTTSCFEKYGEEEDYPRKKDGTFYIAG